MKVIDHYFYFLNFNFGTIGGFDENFDAGFCKEDFYFDWDLSFFFLDFYLF
jgi:hypothetical protein